MLGAFVYGKFAGESAAEYCATHSPVPVDEGQIEKERARVWGPLSVKDGLPPAQVEYKLRRMVNDYLQPPKITRKMEIGLQRFGEISEDLSRLSAADPHELMRAMEIHFIRDCAEMAAVASLYRKESRWGLYHYRADYPDRDDKDWFVHVQLKKGEDGNMTCFTRPIAPYIVPLDEQEKTAYEKLRIVKEPATI
jgi:succinate dehydrogenase/fumarate reductase flavoprotein subunit